MVSLEPTYEVTGRKDDAVAEEEIRWKRALTMRRKVNRYGIGLQLLHRAIEDCQNDQGAEQSAHESLPFRYSLLSLVAVRSIWCGICGSKLGNLLRNANEVSPGTPSASLV